MTDRTQPRPRPLDYEPPAPRDAPLAALVPFLRRARVVTVPAVAAGVWFVTVLFRTMGAGDPWARDLLACCVTGLVLGGVPAAAAWLGLRPRRYVPAVLLTALLPALLADGYASLEERLFVARCRGLPAATPAVYKDRWWPNGGHYLYYEPGTGRLGGGD